MGLGIECQKRLNRSTRHGQWWLQLRLCPDSKNHGVQSKGHLRSYPTHKVFVKVSKGSVLDMASKINFRHWQRPSQTFWYQKSRKRPFTTSQSGKAIYRYQCINLGCDDEYIGETSTGPLVKDTKIAPEGPLCHPSPQLAITGHTTNHNNFTRKIGREGHNLARTYKGIYLHQA